MISFVFRLVRFGFSLFLGTVLTLAILALQVRYEGHGRFQVRLKERLGLEETFLWRAPAASSPTRPAPAGAIRPLPAPSPAGAGRSTRLTLRSRAPRSEECQAVRRKLDASLERYRARTRRSMEALDIFALLDTGVLDELPACPYGGSFRLSSGTPAAVVCTMHGRDI